MASRKESEITIEQNTEFKYELSFISRVAIFFTKLIKALTGWIQHN